MSATTMYWIGWIVGTVTGLGAGFIIAVAFGYRKNP